MPGAAGVEEVAAVAVAAGADSEAVEEEVFQGQWEEAAVALVVAGAFHVPPHRFPGQDPAEAGVVN